MDRIIIGALKFMDEGFMEHKELFENLADNQTPHSVFIGCADSRVVPNLITNTLPGELFVIRNIANIVPPYRVSQEYVATTAAIEYALYSLNIKNIIICGHSNCGGCDALYYDEEKLNKIPNVKRWLDLLVDIKTEVAKYPNLTHSKRAWITERLNIINSVNNIFTFPNIKDGYQKGDIKIFGWHYIIETGELFNYDIENGHFKLLERDMDYEKIYNQLFTDF